MVQYQLIYFLILSPNHWLLASGTSLQAKETAFMIKSLTLILTLLSLLSFSLKLKTGYEK